MAEFDSYLGGGNSPSAYVSGTNFSASYEASEFCWQIAVKSLQHLRPLIFFLKCSGTQPLWNLTGVDHELERCHFCDVSNIHQSVLDGGFHSLNS